MRTIPLASLFTALLFGTPLLAGSPPEGDWPHWLGPTRDGISTERGWNVEGAVEPLWSAELGLGYANVSISEGRLYTSGFDEEGEEDILWCLDPSTGEELWVHSYPARVMGTFHGGGTLTTPSVDGDRVYVTNRFGRLFCLSAADGEVLWERDYAEELELRINFHGCSSSPLVLENRLILCLSGVTAAVNKDGGTVIWQTEDSGDGGHANPVPFELLGVPSLATFNGKGLEVLARSDGERIQFHDFGHTSGGINAATPIVFGSRVFISAAYNKGAALIELGGDEPDFLWRCRKMRNKVSSCILWRDHFFGFDESMLRCIDMEGKEVWRVRGLGMGTLGMADGKLLILSSKGELIVAEANPEEFVELSRRKVLDGGVYWTPPVLLHGLIYCRNSLGSLVCLDHRSTSLAEATPGGEATGELPKADELLAGHVRKIGGETAWRERKSMRIDGDIEILGAGITRTSMTIHRAAPASWLLNYSLGRFGETYRGYDGEIAWQLDPFYGNRIEKGDSLREIEETRPFFAILDWRALYEKMTTVGTATFGGRRCWQVDAISKKGASRQLYFECESGLQAGRSGEDEAQVIFEEYREFEGLSLPTRITRILPETGEEETYFVEEVTFDEVDPGVFERPEEVVKMLWTPEEIAARDAEARKLHGAYLGTYVGTSEPVEGVEFVIAITRGDLVISTGDQPELAIHGPDEEGWFAPTREMGFSVRFEDEKDGVTETLRLRSPRGETALTRKDADQEE
jgi:outer membrane protein assembly factor BamB